MRSPITIRSTQARMRFDWLGALAAFVLLSIKLKGTVPNPPEDVSHLIRRPLFEPRPCNATILANNVHLATPAEVHKKYPSLFASLPSHYDDNFKSPCWFKSSNRSIFCLPYAYIIGVAKCGTTDLYTTLCQHEDVLPNNGGVDGRQGGVGELYFWNGIPSTCYRHEFAYPRVPFCDSTIEGFILRYPQLIQRLEGKKSSWSRAFTIDASVLYAGGDFWTPRLLFEAQPQARIIMRTRRPSARANSDWTYSGIKGNPNVILPQKVKQFQDCLNQGGLEYDCFDAGKFNIVVMGLYIIIIEHWLRVFPSTQFLVSPLETGTVASAMDLVHFLNLTEFTPNVGQHTNKQKWKIPFDNNTYAVLDEFYQPYNERLLEFVKDKNNPRQSDKSIEAIESYLHV